MIQEDAPLDALYHDMRAGRISPQTLEAEMVRHILSRPRKYAGPFTSRADFTDFICALYPRLKQSVPRYRETGASFDAYISSVIAFASRNEALRARRRERREGVCGRELGRLAEEEAREAQAAQAAFEVCEAGDAYAAGMPRMEFCGTRFTPRQMLVALLKTYDRASERQIRCVAAYAGVEEAALYGFIEELRGLRTGAAALEARRRGRVSRQFYRYLELGERLRQEGRVEDEALLRERGLLDRARERLSRTRQGATNREVALVLGLPKGTVDSCVYKIRQIMRGQGGGDSCDCP